MKRLLRDVLSPRNEIVHPHANPRGEAIFVGLEHIEPGIGIRTGSLRIRLEDLTGRKTRFKAGDVLYGYLRPYLNKVWVAEFDGVCSVDQYVFKVNRALAMPEYVAAYLRSPIFLAAAPVAASPGQLPRIRTDEVLRTPLPLPDLHDQDQLVRRLAVLHDLFARGRRAAEESARATSLLRGKLLSRAFAGTEPLATREGLEAPSGWRWHRLDAAARLESGHTPSRQRLDWWGGEIPWIALPDIRALDGRVATDTAEHTNPEGIANSAARVLPEGTVVMSRTASVGFVAQMGRPMATSQDFVNWVCGPSLNPEFLVFLLMRSREFIRSLASGATHKTVYVPTVKSFRVCVPPIAEQRRIAARLRNQLAQLEIAEAGMTEQGRAINALPAALLRWVFDRAATDRTRPPALR